MSLEELLNRDQGISVHCKHCHEKRCNVQFKSIKSLKPSLLSLRARYLWNQLPDHAKNETSVKAFKIKLAGNW